MINITSPLSRLLERASDYLTHRSQAVEHSCFESRPGQQITIPGRFKTHVITVGPLGSSWFYEFDDKHRISEALELATSFLAHPLGGKRITTYTSTPINWFD
jgi:hypothetical protein